MLWLPPNVWLHGSQSSSTGGSSSRNGQTCRICCWLAAICPCVLRTPFGVPVEPDVKRIFAMSVRPSAAQRASTSSVGAAPNSSWVSAPGRSRPSTARPPATASTAGPNGPPSATTTPGSARSAMARSFSWSLLCSAYATLVGTTGEPTVSAASVMARCSRLLPDSTMTGRPASPRSSRPWASRSASARSSPQLPLVHPPSAARSATSSRSGCTSLCARKECTTLTGWVPSGSVDRMCSRPPGRGSASIRGVANVPSSMSSPSRRLGHVSETRPCRPVPPIGGTVPRHECDPIHYHAAGRAGRLQEELEEPFC